MAAQEHSSNEDGEPEESSSISPMARECHQPRSTSQDGPDIMPILCRIQQTRELARDGDLQDVYASVQKLLDDLVAHLKLPAGNLAMLKATNKGKGGSHRAGSGEETRTQVGLGMDSVEVMAGEMHTWANSKKYSLVEEIVKLQGLLPEPEAGPQPRICVTSSFASTTAASSLGTPAASSSTPSAAVLSSSSTPSAASAKVTQSSSSAPSATPTDAIYAGLQIELLVEVAERDQPWLERVQLLPEPLATNQKPEQTKAQSDPIHSSKPGSQTEPLPGRLVAGPPKGIDTPPSGGVFDMWRRVAEQPWPDRLLGLPLEFANKREPDPVLRSAPDGPKPVKKQARDEGMRSLPPCKLQ
mmetsp:Transcript_57535/g.106279  ORF Transcript_57535/g.106279 Transcript_57535/m.106279 type:complete len:356 (-) Transcript_57535:284-1351(-)